MARTPLFLMNFTRTPLRHTTLRLCRSTPVRFWWKGKALSGRYGVGEAGMTSPTKLIILCMLATQWARTSWTRVSLGSDTATEHLEHATP